MALSIFHNDNYGKFILNCKNFLKIVLIVERAAGNLVADILQEYRENEDYNGPLDQVIKVNKVSSIIPCAFA